MKRNHLLTAVYAIAAALLIISASIALPIAIRPFYYAHIEPLSLEAWSGHSAADIRAAYDEVLNYLTLPWCEFGTGVFAHSAEGADHFADCRDLFLLDGAVLLASSVVLAVLGLLARRGKWTLARPFGRHVLLTVGVTVLATFCLVGGLAALDFDLAFTVFHLLFFPGKDNWTFDPRTDEIILVLPQIFFRNCAILIVSGIVLCAVSCIVYACMSHKRATVNLK